MGIIKAGERRGRIGGDTTRRGEHSMHGQSEADVRLTGNNVKRGQPANAEMSNRLQGNNNNTDDTRPTTGQPVHTWENGEEPENSRGTSKQLFKY